jgi:hypothetical protein
MTMTARQNRRMIYGLASALALLAVATGTGALLAPATVAVGESSLRLSEADHTTGPAAVQATNDRPDLAALRQICQRPLRGPLFDEQAKSDPTTPHAPQAATVMNLRLVGTILEAGHSMAMFSKPDGSIVLCAVGQTTAPEDASVFVEEVTSLGATVRHNGKRLQLTLPKPPGGQRP